MTKDESSFYAINTPVKVRCNGEWVQGIVVSVSLEMDDSFSVSVERTSHSHRYNKVDVGSFMNIRSA